MMAAGLKQPQIKGELGITNFKALFLVPGVVMIGSIPFVDSTTASPCESESRVTCTVFPYPTNSHTVFSRRE
ncbi:MAG: hypothetical protein ACHRXM_39800 [Isosphaerales bacterium]